MKIVCLSDTHTMHENMAHAIPPGDVLVHAGDFSSTGKHHENIEFAKWFASQPHKHKLVICGNHEREYSGNVAYYKQLLEQFGGNVKFIHNELVQIDGLNFYGESRSPTFGNWGWMYDPGQEASDVWDKLPEETDVLICHGPPLEFGDVCPDYFNRPRIGKLIHVGCPELARRLVGSKIKWLVCGHIHFSHGAYKTPWGPTVVNASTCTEAYQPINKPIVIDTVLNTVSY